MQLPDSVSLIGQNAFSGCSALTEIRIPCWNCEIYDAASTISNDGSTFKGIISGMRNSTAAAYAEKYGYIFMPLDSETTTSSNPIQPLKGDYNNDRTVNVADAVLLARFLAEDNALMSNQIHNILNAEPDYDSDGFVTILDVAALLK